MVYMLTFGDIWGILMVNATIYSTHGSYGIGPFHRIFAPSSTKTLRCTARATAALRASRYHGILPVSRRAAVKTRGMLRDPKNNAFEGNPGSSNLCIEIFAHLIICYFLVPRDKSLHILLYVTFWYPEILIAAPYPSSPHLDPIQVGLRVAALGKQVSC